MGMQMHSRAWVLSVHSQELGFKHRSCTWRMKRWCLGGIKGGKPQQNQTRKQALVYRMPRMIINCFPSERGRCCVCALLQFAVPTWPYQHCEIILEQTVCGRKKGRSVDVYVVKERRAGCWFASTMRPLMFE